MTLNYIKKRFLEISMVFKKSEKTCFTFNGLSYIILITDMC